MSNQPPDSHLAPLPNDIETCHKELRTLQRLLIQERAQHLGRIDKIEMIRRSHSGAVRHMQEIIDELQEQIKSYRERLAGTTVL